LLVAACSSPPDVDDPPPQEEPIDSTPAPDATLGVPEELVPFYTQALDWSSCGEFQCATLSVPLDYDDPDDQTIELSVLRSPAEDGEVQGSLVLNPGGPGASGLNYARAAQTVISDQVRENFDIVGFDPRGVGESAPVECIDDAQLDEFVNADATPDDSAEVAELQDQITTYTEGCEAESGDLLPHLGTENVARDLDVLRAALGDSALNYLGKSYGTYIGAVYAELFPDHTGRLVLDGAVDPALPAEEYALGQAEGFEQALNSFITWCVDENCALGGDEDEVRQAIIDLLATADTSPLPTNQDDRPLTQALAFYGLVVPFYWPASSAYPTALDALEQAIVDDDGAGLLELADLYLERNADGSYADNSLEAFFAVSCLDHPESTTPEDAEGLAETFSDSAPVFGATLAWGGLTCAQWPVVSSVTPTPIAAPGAAPTLVVGTTGDPATPYAWAQALAEQLDSGVLLTHEGTGHTAYRTGNDCVDRAVDGYFISGTLPDEGTTC
jgi:pimeloyl-ACP methyl ester carboxylesterase